MNAGETKTFPLTFPGRLSRQGSRGQGRRVHADGEERRGRESSPASTPNSRARSASRAAASTSSRPRSQSNLKLELKRKVEAKVKEQVFAALRAEGAVRAAEIAGRNRSAEHDAADGRGACASRA